MDIQENYTGRWCVGILPVLKKEVHCLLSISYGKNRAINSEALENILQPKTVSSVVLDYKHFASFHMATCPMMGTFGADLASGFLWDLGGQIIATISRKKLPALEIYMHIWPYEEDLDISRSANSLGGNDASGAAAER